jgi:hypothetical protein
MLSPATRGETVRHSVPLRVGQRRRAANPAAEVAANSMVRCGAPDQSAYASEAFPRPTAPRAITPRRSASSAGPPSPSIIGHGGRNAVANESEHGARHLRART